MADDRSELQSQVSHSRLGGQPLFLPVVLIGSIGIWSLYSFGLPQWIVTAFPVLLMLSYLTYELRSGHYKYREDRLGDSAYYLGLLFTLVSLAHALFVFSGADAVGAIVSNFGVALLTTIIGLVSRVLLYEWRGDELEEPELRARIELAEAVERLKVQLSSCVQDLNGFRLQLAQSLTAMVTNASDQVAEAIQEGLVKLRDTAGDIKDAVETSFSSLPGHLTKLNEESAHLAVELENLWKRVSDMRVPPDLLEQELAPAVKGLTKHARLIAKLTLAEEEKSAVLTEMLAKLVLVTEQVSRQTEAAAGSAAAFADFKTEIQEVGTAIHAIGQAAGTANNQLMKDSAESAQVLHNLVSEGVGDLEIAKNHRLALENELAKSRETLTKVQDAMLSMTSLIIHRLGDSGPRTKESGL